jgi:hypothetical protein
VTAAANKVTLIQGVLMVLAQTRASGNIATIAFDNYAKRNALSAALPASRP